MTRVSFLMITFLFIFSIRAYSDDPPLMSVQEKQQIEFDYTFMEGVRYKLAEDYKKALSCFETCMRLDPGSAAVRYEVASILMMGGNFDVALRLMREAIKIDEDNIWYRLLLANILRNKSMIEESCNVYNDLLLSHPDKKDFYLIQVELYVSVEKWSKAIEVLNKYEKHFGVSREISLEKTKLYVQKDDLKMASKELIKLVKKFPDSSEYKGLLAEFYLDHNQEKRGLGLLKKLLKENPSDGFLQFYLADYYLKKGDTLQSNYFLHSALLNDKNESTLKVQYLLKVLTDTKDVGTQRNFLYKNILLLLEKYPDDLPIRLFYADILKQDGELEKCKYELEFVISKDQNNFLVWEELLLLYNRLEDIDSMISKGKECIRFFPDKPLPYVMIGVPLLMRKAYEESIYYFKEGLKLSLDNTPMKGQLYAYLGDAYYGLDSIELTFKMFDEALKINPEDILVLNNYSYYLALLDRHLDEAERMSSKTLTIDPNNPTFLDTYAWVLFKRKNYSLAKFYMRSAIEKNKEPFEIYYDHYGDILFMNGENEEAVKMWKKSLELNDYKSDELKRKIKYGMVLENE